MRGNISATRQKQPVEDRSNPKMRDSFVGPIVPTNEIGSSQAMMMSTAQEKSDNEAGILGDDEQDQQESEAAEVPPLPRLLLPCRCRL